jgi:serine/threonine-protein kinase
VDDIRTHDMRTTGEPIRDVAIGDDIGGYVVDGELGTGGMGVVYSAVHPVIGKRAAIKVLRAELSDDPDAVGRFIREAKVVNQIHHPNIVDIFALDRLPSGQHYMVMDLLEGETLRVRLRRGALALAEATSVLDETAAALIAAHDQGIVHRDLKPENVFLVATPGRWPAVKLLDFGVAKLLRVPTPALLAAMPVTMATATGVALGTPWYMSPEQARGKNIDHRSDIYALGVMAYEVITGVRPFHVLADGGSLADHAASTPRDLVDAIEQMIAEDADARPSLALVRAAIKRARRTLRSEEVMGPAASAPAMVQVTAQPDDELDAGATTTWQDDGQTTRRPPAAFLQQPTTVGVPPPPSQRRAAAPAPGPATVPGSGASVEAARATNDQLPAVAPTSAEQAAMRGSRTELVHAPARSSRATLAIAFAFVVVAAAVAAIVYAVLAG